MYKYPSNAAQHSKPMYKDTGHDLVPKSKPL